MVTICGWLYYRSQRKAGERGADLYGKRNESFVFCNVQSFLSLYSSPTAWWQCFYSLHPVCSKNSGDPLAGTKSSRQVSANGTAPAWATPLRRSIISYQLDLSNGGRKIRRQVNYVALGTTCCKPHGKPQDCSIPRPLCFLQREPRGPSEPRTPRSRTEHLWILM